MAKAIITLARDGGSFEVDMDTFPADILARLAIHGLQQKVADSCADKAKYADKAAIVLRSQGVIDNLKAGTWAERAVGPRATTFETFLHQEAVKAAKARMEKDEKAKAAGLEFVASRYATNESFIAATRKLWDARTAKVDDVEI